MSVWLLLAFGGVWCVAQWADRVALERDLSPTYTELRLSGTVNVTPWMITLHTERFNRRLTKLGHKLSCLSRLWYGFGTLLTLLVFGASIPFLITSIINNDADYTAWFIKVF